MTSAVNEIKNTIFALIMREVVTRYGKRNIGILWLVFEPMLFTAAITLLWIFSGLNVVSDLNIIAFALTGYSCVLVWRNASARCLNAVDINSGLLYHRMVRPFEIFISRILLEIVGVTTSFILLTMILYFIGKINFPVSLYKVLIGWVLLCFYSIGLGLVVGVLSEISEVFERVWHVVTYVLFPVSGAVFLVDWLPTSVQKVVLLLPMVHGVELVRSGYLGEVFVANYDLSYLVLNVLLLNILGITGCLYLNKVIVPR